MLTSLALSVCAAKPFFSSLLAFLRLVLLSLVLLLDRSLKVMYQKVCEAFDMHLAPALLEGMVASSGASTACELRGKKRKTLSQH